MKNESNKSEQPPALKKGDLKLRAMSINPDEQDSCLLSSSGPYFFQVLSGGSDFFRIPCQPGSVGAPQLYRPSRATAQKQMGLISNFGIELYNDVRKPLPKNPIPTERPEDQPFGIAFEGDTFYVPRDNNTLYAVEGMRGVITFDKKCADRISTPPAVTRESKLLGICDVKGRIVILNIKTDNKEVAQATLDAPSSVGLAATADSFVAATDDAALSLVSGAGGKPVWTVKLPARPLFTPAIHIPKKNARDPIPVAIVCCDQVNGLYSALAFSLQNGTLLWRARIPAKPVAATTGPDSAYISTIEGELMKFDIAMPTSN